MGVKICKSAILIGLIQILILLSSSLFCYISVKNSLIITNNYFSNILSTIFIISSIYWLPNSTFWLNSETKHRKFLVYSIIVFFTGIFFSLWFQVLASILLFISALSFLIKEKKIYKFQTTHILFFSYFLVHLISLIWVTDLQSGIAKISTYTAFVTFPLAFSFFQLSKKELDWIIYVFFKVAFLFVVVSLLCWIFQSYTKQIPLLDWLIFHKKFFFVDIQSFTMVYSWSNYSHPTYNALIYLTAIVFGFYLTDKSRQTLRVKYFELAALITLSFLLNTVIQSRIGFANLTIISLLGFLWMIRHNGTLYKIYLANLIILSVLTPIIFNKQIASFFIDQNRKQLYITAFAYIKNNLILGTGVGGLAKIIESSDIAHSLGYQSACIHLGNPHNQFVGDLMQTGIMGLIALIAMITQILYRSLKTKNWILLGFMGFSISTMLIEMSLSLQKGIFFFVPVVCLLIQKTDNNRV